MIFQKIRTPQVKLPRTGNRLADEVIGLLEPAIGRLIDTVIYQINDGIGKVFGRLNSSLSLLCVGQELDVTIEPREYTTAQNITIKHELGVKPTRWLILNAEPVARFSSDGQEWDGNTCKVPGLVRPPEEWTDSYILLRPTEGTMLYGGKFKILIMP